MTVEQKAVRGAFFVGSGKFLGCGKWPKCKFTKPLPEELNALAASTEK